MSIALSPALNRNTGTSAVDVALEAQAPRAFLVRNAVFLQEHRDAVGAVVVQVQAHGRMLVRGAFEHGADQTRLESARKSASLRRATSRRLRSVARLLVAAEQALVLAQRVLDLAVLRQAAFVGDAEPRCGLELGLAIVAQAVFGDQARRFDRDAAALLVRAVLA